MLIQGIRDVSVSRFDNGDEIVRNLKWGVNFKFHTDIRKLFPIINGAVNGTRYCYRPVVHVHFVYQSVQCTLYPEEAMAAPLKGQAQSIEFLSDLVMFLNNLYERSEDLPENHNFYHKSVGIEGLLKSIPRIDCKECGHPTCTAFVKAYRKGSVTLDACKELSQLMPAQTFFPMIGENGSVESTYTIENTSILTHRTFEGLVEKKSILPTNSIADLSPKTKASLFDRNGIRIQYDLSPREIEVLRLIAEGDSNPVISNKLKISPHTVKSHIIHIFNKLNVNDRTQAAVWAVKNQII